MLSVWFHLLATSSPCLSPSSSFLLFLLSRGHESRNMRIKSTNCSSKCCLVPRKKEILETDGIRISTTDQYLVHAQDIHLAWLPLKLARSETVGIIRLVRGLWFNIFGFLANPIRNFMKLNCNLDVNIEPWINGKL